MVAMASLSARGPVASVLISLITEIPCIHLTHAHYIDAEQEMGNRKDIAIRTVRARILSKTQEYALSSYSEKTMKLNLNATLLRFTNTFDCPRRFSSRASGCWCSASAAGAPAATAATAP